MFKQIIYLVKAQTENAVQAQNSYNLLAVKPSRQMHIRRSSTENSKANDVCIFIYLLMRNINIWLEQN